MRGILFDTFQVTLDPRSFELGGSWRPDGHAWGPGALKAFFEHAQTLSDPVIVDVGANTGSFALLATLLPGMTVFAFEPGNTAREVLKENVRLNHLATRVFISEYALGETEEIAQLYIPDDSGLSGHAMLFESSRFVSTSQNALVTTLDRFCDYHQIDHVDMLKIDVEGWELPVLRGALRMLKKCHPFLMIEYPTRQRCERPVDIKTWLQGLSYQFSTAIKGELIAS